MSREPQPGFLGFCRDSNQATSDHISEALPLESTCSMQIKKERRYIPICSIDFFNIIIFIFRMSEAVNG
jgi:hypothetical protein